METPLADPILARLPRGLRVLTRRERVGSLRLGAACAQALSGGALTDRRLTSVLDRGVEAAGLPTLPSPTPAATFVGSAAERLGACAGGTAWRDPSSCSPRFRTAASSGVLAPLEARHRQASEGQWASSECLERWREDEVARRAQGR